MITEGQLRLIARYYGGRGREFAFLGLAQERMAVGYCECLARGVASVRSKSLRMYG